MPIKVKRKDGTTSTIKNSVYLPAYYLIPKELLENNCKEILKIPRIPIKALSTYESIELIESDFFLEVIIDMYAYMVWNCLYPQVYLEIYSGYDPIWKLVHQAPIWIKLLIDERIIFTVEQLCKWSKSNREIEMDFVSLEEATLIMNYIVAKYIVQNNLREIIKVIEENRCEEDFDFRNSRQKTDFLRKWYHTRTNHPSISLEEWQENYKEKHNGNEYEIPSGAKYYKADGTEASPGGTFATGAAYCVFDWTVAGSEITISSETFPGTYYVTGDTYARSEKDGTDEFFQFIIPKAKVQSEVTLTMEAEGDPSTFSMNLKVLRPADKEMMKLVKYNIPSK